MDMAEWEALFRRIYCLVCSRCYGSYLPYTFLAPILDMVNHDHNYDTGIFLFNKGLHLDPLSVRSYFKSGKYLNNTRMMYKTDSAMDLKGRSNHLTRGFV